VWVVVGTRTKKKDTNQRGKLPTLLRSHFKISLYLSLLWMLIAPDQKGKGQGERGK
jgi:hypothetical protein